MTSFCGQCGALVDPTGKFCTSCGAPLGSGLPSRAEDAPSIGTISTSNRICEWCAESIPGQALRCPKCQKWRKDIDQERVLSYVWGFASLVPAVFFVAGVENGLWLSLRAFLMSMSGWIVLGGFLICGYFSLVYYARVSRKIGSWFWF